MCGRYSLEVNYELFSARYDLEIDSHDYIQSKEIFPTQKSEVVLANRKVAVLKWGAPLDFTKQVLINVRTETIFEKSRFESRILTQRCLVPATSFFEWQKTDSSKLKKKVFVESARLFSMAGLVMESQGERYFAVLTKEANEQFKAIHHRMPVIFNAALEQQYLDSKLTPIELNNLFISSNPSFVIVDAD